MGDLEAMVRASSAVASASRGSGTTRLISPMRWASVASIMSPVSNISRACLGATVRVRATIGVEQNRPMFTPGVAKRDDSPATARSQLATSWHPAAVATPATCAITGRRRRVSCIITLEQRAKRRSRNSGSSLERTSRRSCPAQNAGPAPVSTTTCTVGSASTSSSRAASASSMGSDRALRAAGRFSVSVATWSRSERSTSGWSRLSPMVRPYRAARSRRGRRGSTGKAGRQRSGDGPGRYDRGTGLVPVRRLVAGRWCIAV